MALFITLEGGEGCGKSVQAKALYKRLSKLAVPAILIHEPGVTALGEKISHWLKWTQDTGVSPVAELLLFNASRAQLVAEVIRPNLEDGKVVVCDRYMDSTAAYQGYGRGLDLQLVRVVNEAGTMGLKPDLTVLLDMPAEVSLARKGNKKHDRFEAEDISFHQRVRNGFLKLAVDEPERWLVVDASQPKEKVAQIIWERVNRLLSVQKG